MKQTSNYLVFYQKEISGTLLLGVKLTIKQLSSILAKDYRFVSIVNAPDYDIVFWKMQAENWSPNGEEREHIRQCGVSHTSMMVGDVIYSEYSGNWYVVDSVGFMEIEIQ